MDRARKQSFPKLPKNREDLVLPNDLKIFKGEEFLLSDDTSSERIFMFSSEKFIKLFSRVDTIYLDGTFYVCPDIYKQLYTIHVLISGQMILIAYFLLPGKEERIYIKMLHILQDVANDKFNIRINITNVSMIVQFHFQSEHSFYTGPSGFRRGSY